MLYLHQGQGTVQRHSVSLYATRSGCESHGDDLSSAASTEVHWKKIDNQIILYVIHVSFTDHFFLYTPMFNPMLNSNTPVCFTTACESLRNTSHPPRASVQALHVDRRWSSASNMVSVKRRLLCWTAIKLQINCIRWISRCLYLYGLQQKVCLLEGKYLKCVVKSSFVSEINDLAYQKYTERTWN